MFETLSDYLNKQKKDSDSKGTYEFYIVPNKAGLSEKTFIIRNIQNGKAMIIKSFPNRIEIKKDIVKRLNFDTFQRISLERFFEEIKGLGITYTT